MTDEIVLKILRDFQARQTADSRRLEIIQQDIHMLVVLANKILINSKKENHVRQQT